MHQELALSPCHCTLVMEEVDKQGDIPWCILTNDVVLVDESMVEVYQNMKLWR
jgi:hypothetical protein